MRATSVDFQKRANPSSSFGYLLTLESCPFHSAAVRPKNNQQLGEKTEESLSREISRKEEKIVEEGSTVADLSKGPLKYKNIILQCGSPFSDKQHLSRTV
ncbi:Hypothetical protein NTJ_10683 [Nesidiocoris tenuis]|uniref:Uncharacterized protein n=1 Tax=Nesidiocoris tenuis TaxID=355587 RepID=A0ABN7B0C5_9HEMI|nr:Hypothetical protein NTJ_10683 [Nesidiocoris tenuis]